MADKRVTGIGGIFVRAENPSSLARWYAEKLDVPLEGGIPDTDSEGPVTAMFKWRDQDNADRIGSTVWAIFPKATDYLGDGPVMINYRVEDMDAVLKALESEGVWVDPHREDHEYGRFAWIRDPEGNRIELWQPLGE